MFVESLIVNDVTVDVDVNIVIALLSSLKVSEELLSVLR